MTTIHAIHQTPYFQIHPCKTSEWMANCQSNNYIATWLSHLAPIVGLPGLPNQYFQDSWPCQQCQSDSVCLSTLKSLPKTHPNGTLRNTACRVAPSATIKSSIQCLPHAFHHIPSRSVTFYHTFFPKAQVTSNKMKYKKGHQFLPWLLCPSTWYG